LLNQETATRVKGENMHSAIPSMRHAARFGCLALLSALAAPAHAIEVTYSQFFDYGFNSTVLDHQFPNTTYDPTRLLPDFTLPRFDASLGTLQSVDISWNSFYVHQVQAFGTDQEAEITNFISCSIVPFFPCFYKNDASVSVIVDSSIKLELLDFPLTASLNVGQQQLFCSTSGEEDETVQCHDTTGLNGFFNGSLDTSSVPLSSFIGSDPLGFGLEANYSLFGKCDDDDQGDGCLVDIEMPWSGTLFLTYTYAELTGGGDDGGGSGGGDGGSGGGSDPAEVPEPGPLGLMAVAGLAALIARRRSAREPAV
jgi:hypothetical protein